jgi:4-carboxymuconolactone decarboxylase
MTIFSSFGFRLTSPFFLTFLLTQTNTLHPQQSLKIIIPPTQDIVPDNNFRGRQPKLADNNTAMITPVVVPRYNGPTVEDMTEQQKEIRETILQSRPRTGLNGPFGPWLAIPEIAGPASSLGKACRYDTSLSFRESELVILLTGAKMRSATEFTIHIGEAVKAGLTMDVISAIPKGDDFSIQTVNEQLVPLLDSIREKSIVQFATELLDSCTVSDETYSSTKAALDDKDSVLVEITSIVGYYTYVSYTLNVFNIPPN